MNDYEDNTSVGQAPATDESGFGLVESVISMFPIASVAIAFLPRLIRTRPVSAENVTTAAGTQLVNSELTQAQRRFTCTQLADFVAQTVAPTIDSRGVALQPVRELGDCPTVFPGTVPFTSEVKQADGSTVAHA